MITDDSVKEGGMKLLRKLKEKDALEAFVRNSDKTQIKSRLTGGLASYQILNGSFHWASTPEGKHYWRDIHNELLRDRG